MRPFPSLRCEELETRDTPSTFTWTGTIDSEWSRAGNWKEGVAPTGDPAAIEDLVFGIDGAARLTSDNNLASASTFNSISFGISNYRLTGNPLTLGRPGVTSSGTIAVNAGALNEVIALGITLNAGTGIAGNIDQTISIQTGGSLTITGNMTGPPGSTLAKDGPGTLTLSGDNQLITGPIKINDNSGTLIVTSPTALGTFTPNSPAAPLASYATTVGVNSTLAVQNITGSGIISEPVILNGRGVANAGALQNFAGTNTWAGQVVLDTTPTTGVAIGSTGGTLVISGVVSDTGTGQNLLKEGLGEVQLTAANTYRGLTTINDGILTISDPLALGASGQASNGTVVNETLNGAGQLRLENHDASRTGFAVFNEQLTLNGDGYLDTIPARPVPAHFGALTNTIGNNTWAGPVIIGSPAPNPIGAAIGAAAGTDLIISGVVSSPNDNINNPAFVVVKRDTGRVILNNANTYFGRTIIAEGILDVRDSNALGYNGPLSGTIVRNGATLQLEVEAATDPNGTDEFLNSNGRDLWNDSVTNNPNKLTFTEPLSISGFGFNSIGALDSRSGINVWSVGIALDNEIPNVSIGVDADQRPGHPTPDSTYFTADYSLTVQGNPTVGGLSEGFTFGGTAPVEFFNKVGLGNLILPIRNTYTAITNIRAGWITAQDNNSLGERIPGIGDTVQPGTVISDGAALHLRPLTTSSLPLTIPENIKAVGIGIDHPYQLIGKKGAIMNLGGVNTLTGDIKVRDQVGIGVETIAPYTTSELTTTGSISDYPKTQQFDINASGGQAEQAYILDAGAVFGSVTVTYDAYSIPDRFTVFYPSRAEGGSIIFDTGYVPFPYPNSPPPITIPGAGSFTVPFGPGTSSNVEVVVNLGGGNPGTAWEMTVLIASNVPGGGINKYGSHRLNIQGDGSYTAATNILEGTLRVQNDTSLGLSSSGTNVTQQTYTTTNTTVSSGALLQFDTNVAQLNGGMSSGVQITNEHLTLNRPAQQIAIAGDEVTLPIPTFQVTFNGSVASAPIPINATATDLANILNAIPQVTAAGGVVVTRTGNVFTVVFGNTLDADVPMLQLVAGSLTGDGEVTISGGNYSVENLANDNAWRGPVTLAGGSRVNVFTNSRLSLLGNMDDAPNLLPAGSEFVKRGPGELVLSGSNSYRGTTLIDAGILTIGNGNALGSAASGTLVSDGAQLQLQGSLTVAGEALTLRGKGVADAQLPAVTEHWYNVGETPTNNGLSGNTLPTSGRVTSIATDPSDSNVIYIATAGGGAWKSKDNGHTWLPLFDDPAIARATLYGAGIVLDQNDPRIIYFATGDSNGTPNGQNITGPNDNFAGTGVYKSLDSGRTWTLVTGIGGANPISGMTITKMILDPNTPGQLFVSTGDRNAVNLSTGKVPGIWRFNGSTWSNMTATTARATPGPSDEADLNFPQSQATWSDILLLNGRLFAALGECNQVNGANAVLNGVFWTNDLSSGAPTWLMGGNNGQNPAFDFSSIANGPPRNGYIKLAGAGNTVYATIARPTVHAQNGMLWDIQKTTDLGTTWASVGSSVIAPIANLFGTAANGIPALGRYDHTALVNPNNPNELYIGGLNVVVRTQDGATTAGGWVALTDPSGVAPGPQFHTLFLDQINGNGPPQFRLLTGSDGGIWAFNSSASAYTDLNGTLTTMMLNSADSHPTDINKMIAGASDNGTMMLGRTGTTAPAWQRVDTTVLPGYTTGTNAGIVRYDPTNSQIAYSIRDSFIRRTLDGGTTWTTVQQGAFSTFPFIVDPVTSSRLLVGGDSLYESIDRGNFFVPLYPAIGNTLINVSAIGAAVYQGQFVADPSFPVVTDRLPNAYDPDTIYVTDGTNLLLTKDHGLTWVNRNTGITGRITDIAVDPSNRDTVFVTTITTGTTMGGKVFRSNDAGQTWTDISGVSPTGLINVPAWKIIVDPRSHTADPRSDTIYVGNDDGVWMLPNGATTNTLVWSRVGVGMPHVQVRDLVLNQTLNTITAATHGRGAFQLFLTDYDGNSGAIRAISGSSLWTGNVTLAGSSDVYIGAAGSQQLQNGIAAASLNFLGTITDDTFGANHDIIKVGSGTITFSGDNLTGTVLGGDITVESGVLEVNNPHALGSPVTGTTLVKDGAALNLRSDLELEPITINGNGIKYPAIGGGVTGFNGHFTGALRNVANNNTYTGPLTFGTATSDTLVFGSTTSPPTNTTIGVDSGSVLTIGSLPGVLLGNGSITDGGSGFRFDKEQPGTLILANANNLTGATRVVQGALQVQHANALGSSGSAATGTSVLDGAQLQISRNAATLAATVVANESLSLSGTGINTTGALTNVRGDTNAAGTNNNTWAGPIQFNQSNPNFSPGTNPGSQVALGSSDARDTLIIDTVLDQDSTQASFGLIKVGAGRVQLNKSSNYTGVTNINAGTLQVRNNTSLGPVQPSGPFAGLGVSSEVQTISLVGTTIPGTPAPGTPYNFQLQFTNPITNVTSTTGNLASNIPANGVFGSLRAALGALPSIGGTANIIVSETFNSTGKVFTISFTGALANIDLPMLVWVPVAPAGLAVNIAEVQKGGLGTVVASGAALELAGVPNAINVPEVLTLNGDGAGTTRAGALDNVTNNNTYSGPITLASNTSIGAEAGTTLTLAATATVQDPNPSPVPAASLRKAAAGTLVFPFANTYGGKTTVDEGVLRINNKDSLGTSRNEVQNVNVSGSNGSFTLTFNGQTTGLIPWNATAAQVQTALNALPNIGSEVQTLKVAGTTGSFTVTFNGQTTVALPVGVAASGGVGPTASLQNALNALSSIGGSGGSVVVTSSAALGGGTVYTITFGGSLGASNQTQIVPTPIGAAQTFPNTVRDGGVYALVTMTGSAGNANYRIEFTGPLANTNFPEMIANRFGGAVPLMSTIQDGAEGTVVTSGATLQVDAGVGTMTGEALTINGLGFNGQGALNNIAGTNSWTKQITLGSDASIGASSGNLQITQPITDTGATRNLDIIGQGATPGTVTFVATADNQYNGITTVRSGTLDLNQSVGLAILGPLVVGDGLTGAATLRELQNDQIGDGVQVTVKSDGTFNLNGMSDQIATLTIQDGLALTGNGGTLITTGVVMTGGTLNIGSGGQVLLSGNITATSSLTSSAVISGPGAVNLSGLTRTALVNDGPQNEDLRFSAGIISSVGERFVKDGPGRLTFFPASPITTVVEDKLGDIQVDTQIGAVQLTGGSLSGNGTVGTITGRTSPPAIGLVTPGVSYAANPIGTLTTGNVTWGPQTQFFVNLQNDVPGSPTVPGVDNDLLLVNGNIDLGGATLRGTFGANIQDLDTFTIIQTTGGGTVSNQFASGGVVFIGQQKFTIDYSDPTKVVLNKVKANVTLNVLSSQNPSTLNENITFSVQVVPEAGAGSIPAGSTATFTLDGTTYPAVPVIGGVATFDPQSAIGGVLSGGTHTLHVDFSGDPLSFNAQSGDLVGGQLVEVPGIKSLSATTVYISPNNTTSVGVKDATTISTDGINERASNATTPAWNLTISDLGNIPVRSFSGVGVISGNTFHIAANWNGTDDFGGFVADGTYLVTASYIDLYNNTAATPGPLDPAFTITVDNTSPQANPLANPNPVIAPGTASTVPNGTTFTSSIVDANLQDWTVEIRNSSNVLIRTFTGTTAAVNATWDGTDSSTVSFVPNGVYTAKLIARDLAGNSFTTASTQVVVLNQAPTISLSTNSPTQYGQTITLTSTLTIPAFVPASVANLLVGGTVRFFNGANVIGNASIVQSGGQYQAILTVPSFNAGVYTSLHANFLGTGQFLPSNSANTAHSVQQAPLLVTADSKVKVVGTANSPLTFQVSGLTNGDSAATALSGSLATTATTASPIGTYPITQGTLTVTPKPDQNGDGFADINYALTFIDNTLTVIGTPLTVTVTAHHIDKVYGAAVPTLDTTYYDVSGLQNGDTESTVLAGLMATSAQPGSPAGVSFPISQGTLHSINPNYTLAFNGNTLTITSAPLTITADDVSRPRGTPNPTFTATYSGLVNGDTSSVVTGLNLTTTATASSPVGTYPITTTGAPTASNYTITFVPGTLTVTPPSSATLAQDIAVGSGDVFPAQVSVYSNTGTFKYSLFPFPAGFTGGVRTAAGDFNNDGVTDIVAGTGPGIATQVVVIDGATKNTLFKIAPFESTFLGGVYVSAGDITGDGRPDLIITPDEGGGPRVEVFNGVGFGKIADFLGIDDKNFRGGARSAVGDFTGDGIGDLVVAAGFGGGPRVAIYNGQDLTNGQLVKPYNDFFVFEQALRNGAFIAAGDLNGDGIADMITGGGPGGAPRVQVLNGADLLQGKFTAMTNFYAADVDSRGGARVAAKDINNDGLADVVTGDGVHLGSRVNGYTSQTLLAGGTSWQFSFEAFPGFDGGVYVG